MIAPKINPDMTTNGAERLKAAASVMANANTIASARVRTVISYKVMQAAPIIPVATALRPDSTHLNQCLRRRVIQKGITAKTSINPGLKRPALTPSKLLILKR